MRHLLLLVSAACFAPAAQAQVGTPFCFGDACPCGNDDPAAGCGNLGSDGNPATGALLTGSGSTDVFADDLALTVSGVAPSQFGLIFMGPGTTAPIALGDGTLCLAGGLFRFPTAFSDAAGSFTETGVLAGANEIGAPVAVGATWNFQAWYRDGGGPCGAGSNLTNALPVTFTGPGSSGPLETELAGRPITAYPFFERPLASNQGEDLWVNVDPTVFTHLAGQSVDVFVVASRTSAEWDANDVLVDVRGMAQPFTIGSGGVSTGSVLIDAGLLNGTSGVDLGVPYDIVVDVDGDGLLSDGDLIDGRGDRPGVVVVRDTVAPGPYGVSTDQYSLGTFQQQVVFYPSNIANLGLLPVMVVSHGNGHNFQWYDHIGNHMASYGYVVMSHTNNTGPGIDAASDTTLINTDSFFANLDIIAGGALENHVRDDQLIWIGHSRGGEGITRAYDKIMDGDYVPTDYDIEDILLMSSIAPTTFFGQNRSNPYGSNYHLWVGSSDSDVTGFPNQSPGQSFPLVERGFGSRSTTVLHGAGHGNFHNGGGNPFATGPCQIGEAATHEILLGYLVPLAAFYVRDEPAGEDFFWRQWEEFGPIGRPTDPCVVVNLDYTQDLDERLVVDDFQTNTEVDLSSSGTVVSTDLVSLEEGRLQDLDSSLVYNPSDPFNGMSRAGGNLDQYLGIVFSWDDPRFLQWDLEGSALDVRSYDFVAFRAAAIARHPLTVAELGDIVFDVTLVDRWGNTSTVRTGAYGGGVEEPYQRGGGWSNDFEAHRIRLTDFVADGRNLDLTRLAAIRLEFAQPGASTQGAIGIDDLEFTVE